MRWFALSFAASMIAACNPYPKGEPVELRASDYDRSCDSHGDCAAIFEGEFCGCQGCPNAAVSLAGRRDYEEDVEKALKACDEDRTTCGSLEPAGRTVHQASSCWELAELCIDGVCEAFRADNPEDLPRDCVTADDCVVVPGSWTDCSCQTAINHEGFELAMTIRDAKNLADATSCDCVDNGPPICSNGTCYPGDGGEGCDPAAWNSAACK